MSSKSLNHPLPSNVGFDAIIAFLDDQTGVVHCGDIGPLFGYLRKLSSSPHHNVVTRRYWDEAVSMALMGEQCIVQGARRSQWTRAVTAVLPQGAHKGEPSIYPLSARKLSRGARRYVR